MSRDERFQPEPAEYGSIGRSLFLSPGLPLELIHPSPQEGPAEARPPASEIAPGATLTEQVAALESEVARLRVAEKALLESNDALRLLSETAGELLSSDKPQEVIGSLFRKLSVRLGLETYFNYLVDEERGKLRLNSYAGIPPETAAEIEWLEYGQAVCGCVARDADRIVAEDIQHSDDIRTDLVRSFGVTAYACHPLMANGRVIGTFSFGTSRKPYFEPHELALMQAVCDQVSMSMERTLLISQLRQAVRARDEFLSAAAHELKTPITSLRGFAQVILRQTEREQRVDEERLRRVLQVIDRQSERLARLASQLLDVSRIEAGGLSLERTRVDIGQLVKALVEDVGLAEQGHTLALHIHEPIFSMVDPLRLEQVFRNLLDNAVKYSPAGSKIDVDVWRPDSDTVRIAVRDRGTGIPPEYRDRLFDRFSRAHSASHSSGVGLGLHISDHIVRLHGGTIEVETPPDGGARFVISLPVTLSEVSDQWKASDLSS